MTISESTVVFFFFSSRRRHTRCGRDWSSDVCSSDLSRDCDVEISAGSDDLHLACRASHAIRLTQKMLEIGNDLRGEQVAQRFFAMGRVFIQSQQAARSMVAVKHAACRIKREHA